VKLSVRSRYGLRLMHRLAQNYGDGPVRLEMIAQEEEISHKYLSQLVLPLKEHGLITSVRGAKGGYMLSDAPENIQVLTVVEVLEGSVKPVECKDCKKLKEGCVASEVWEMLGNKIYETLSSLTLEDMLKMKGKISA